MLKMFTVYDSKVEAYMKPFFMRSTGEAIRDFTDAVNASDANSVLSKYPSDYTLFELGDFDENTAVFVPKLTPVSLGVAIEYKKVIPSSAETTVY